MKIHERILRTIDGLLAKVQGMRPHLDIPFVSQLNMYLDADDNNNDCGAASVAMIAGAFGIEISPDEVYAMTGVSGDKYLSTWHLIAVLEALGIKATREVGKSIEDFINEKRGIIPLVRYSVIQKWKLNRHSYFGGQHWWVVIGYEKDKDGNVTHYYVRDPLYPKNAKFRRIPKDIFDNSWESAEPIRLAVVTVGEIK